MKLLVGVAQKTEGAGGVRQRAGANLPSWRELLTAAALPPVRDLRFWIVQALILAVVVGHLGLDLSSVSLPYGAPDSITVALFLVPVVYAALNFGLVGSCASAAWGAVLMTPDLIAVDSTNDLWVDAALLAVTATVAIVVGQRVERQLLAQGLLYDALQAHRAAEERYRALFEHSSAPILVADRDGRLSTVNPAARRLFGRRIDEGRLATLVGEPAARALLAGADPDLLTLSRQGRPQRQFKALAAWLPAPGGGMLLQVVLQDVTSERQRQQRTAAYAAEVLKAQEDERRRVAQEIHDEALQTLLYLHSRLLDERGPDLEPLVAHLAGVIGELRTIMAALRPSVLDDLGLVPALRSLVNDFQERTSIDARFSLAGHREPLPPELETALFRVTQEALANVEQHAAAQNVTVSLRIRRREVELEVTDDGAGLPVLAGGGGRGLLGIEERTRLMGGQSEVRGYPGVGTTLRVVLPKAAPAALAARVR